MAVDEGITEISGDLLCKVVLAIPCDFCRARAGETCKKRSGEVLYEDLPVRVHIQRIAPVWVIFKVGYHVGRRDMKEKLRDHDHQDV